MGLPVIAGREFTHRDDADVPSVVIVLFGVAPQDPITLAMAVAVLLVVVVAASWLPARRAALIDPGHAMRV